MNQINITDCIYFSEPAHHQYAMTAYILLDDLLNFKHPARKFTQNILRYLKVFQMMSTDSRSRSDEKQNLNGVFDDSNNMVIRDSDDEI